MPPLGPALKLSVVALLAACAVGCSADATKSDVTLDVYSWWRENSESAAFANVKGAFEDAHPGVHIHPVNDPTAADARPEMARRLLVGYPPSTFQANIGADLLHWAVVDTEDQATSESLLLPLDKLYERIGFTNLRPALLRALSVGPDQVPYGVPINIHRLNVLYYNADSYGTFAQTHLGQSLDSLSTLCPTDRSGDIGVQIATGGHDTFVFGLMAFENVLVGLGGSTTYDRLFKGVASDSDWTLVQQALECVQYLSKRFVRDDENWAQAARRLIDGTAAFMIMGDWVNGEIQDALDLGKVKSIPFPGTSGVYVFTSDTFPLPVRGPHPNETTELLETFADIDRQAEFSRLKGSIPARPEAAELMGDEAKARSDEFDASDSILATSGLFPPYFRQDILFAALDRMTQDGAGPDTVEFVKTYLQDTQSLFKTWQDRLAAPPAEPSKP
jgi:glucose/mannose transport system substrate-binding protein